MTRDNNPDRLDDGARAEAEMNARCEGADDPDERCPRHPSECTCWQVDLDKAKLIASLPAPQGDDGLVRQLEAYDAYVGDMKSRVGALSIFEEGAQAAFRDAASALRAKAAEIERWAKNALDNDDSRIAAESRLASAMEALTEISERHIPDQPAYDAGSDYAWVCRQYASLRTIARTTLSSLKGSAE